MTKYAIIVNDTVHSTPEYAERPEFAPNITLVELPEGSPVQSGWLYTNGEFKEPEHISIEQTTADKLYANNQAYNESTLNLTSGYPQLEKDTWPTQDLEASAWVGDPDTAQTPWVDLAAYERGIDREEYLRRTLVKAHQFKILSAFLTGRRQKYEDAIKAGQSPELDYTLTTAVQLQLQQIADSGMNSPVESLNTAMRGS